MAADLMPAYVASSASTAEAAADVTDKRDGRLVGRVAVVDESAMENAIAGAVSAFQELRHWPSHRRRDVLVGLRDAVADRRERFAELIMLEAGKPVTLARGEVDRCLETLRLAIEAATRIGGEQLPLDTLPAFDGYEGIVRRVPIGPCLFITAFNFPLLLIAHKIAPALACGCPFVLKPAPQTPLTALELGSILAELDLPSGAFSIVPCDNDVAGMAIADDRLRLLSFTGSGPVGWMLKARAGRKRVVLELGGDAFCIVTKTADIERAARRIVTAAFGYAGQSCISVQHVLAHASIHSKLRDRLVDLTASVVVGDPADEATVVGPLISEDDAKRVEGLVNQARDSGATVLAGGSRNGRWFEPTWLEGVPSTVALSCAEVFGPVATLATYHELDDAIARVNGGPNGLQTGIFTNALDEATRAANELEVGGVIVNDVPTTRIDAMPYGGVKASGIGREGVDYAIEEMTERRIVVFAP